MNSQRTVVWQVIPHLALGGATRMALGLCLHLDPERYETLLLTGPGDSGEGTLRDETAAQGITVEVLDALQRDISPLQDLAAIRQLRSMIRERKPDIIHAHGSKALLAVGLAAEGTSALSVHTAHGWSFHEHMSAAMRGMQAAVLRRALKHADAIIAVSEATRLKGLRAGVGCPEQYRVIYEGADLQRFVMPPGTREHARQELDLPPGAPVMGTVMRLSPQKAPLDWLQAARQVAEACPEAYFVVVGGGPLAAEVEAEVNRAGLAPRFRLTGPRHDVERLVSAFDVFALASLWEGFPIVYEEASAAGLPLVGTAVDGAAELIEEGRTGYLVAPRQPAQLAERVVELLQDLQRARAMGEAARERVFGLGLGVPDIVQRHDELFQELLGRRS